MSLPAAPKVPPQVAEQAVRWLVELQGGADDERLRQAWQRWRQAAPEHEPAWRHIEAVNQRLAGIGTPLALAAINAPHSPQRRRALKTLLLVL
ncbi:FecR/PupR family sigma factor regulator, partial [Pseudomonas aeruginosa]|uniref:FecR/PupR family sigma factor regulator n=1 Tax=Pseudomonas aeruginosa TaxID=287 RepID=UPI001179F274